MKRFTLINSNKYYRDGKWCPMGIVTDEKPVDMIIDSTRDAYPPTNKYIAGPIVDRPYEYENLGYEPEELKKFIDEHLDEMHKVDDVFEAGKKAEYDAFWDAYQENGTRTNYKYAFCGGWKTVSPYNNLAIEKVIFNDPATIVFWKDGSKTVVKATNEAFDPEKGLAMAISKKFFGNKGNYFNQIKKWTDTYKAEEPVVTVSAGEAAARASEALKKLSDAFCHKRRW